MNNDLEQFSEERLKELASTPEKYDHRYTCNMLNGDESRALARIALSAKQAKPVYQIEDADGWHDCEKEEYLSLIKSQGIPDVYYRVLYTTPQPAHTEQDGWIKCSERMPEVDEHKPIAIYTGNCIGQGMFVACYDEDGFYDYWDGVEISGISHWMPLPSPPVAAPKPESE